MNFLTIFEEGFVGQFRIASCTVKRASRAVDAKGFQGRRAVLPPMLFVVRLRIKNMRAEGLAHIITFFDGDARRAQQYVLISQH